MKLSKLEELIELYGAETTIGEILAIRGGHPCK